MTQFISTDQGETTVQLSEIRSRKEREKEEEEEASSKFFPSPPKEEFKSGAERGRPAQGSENGEQDTGWTFIGLCDSRASDSRNLSASRSALWLLLHGKLPHQESGETVGRLATC